MLPACFALLLSLLLPHFRRSRFMANLPNHVHTARAPSSRRHPRLPLALPRLPRILLRLRPSPRRPAPSAPGGHPFLASPSGDPDQTLPRGSARPPSKPLPLSRSNLAPNTPQTRPKTTPPRPKSFLETECLHTGWTDKCPATVCWRGLRRHPGWVVVFVEVGIVAAVVASNAVCRQSFAACVMPLLLPRSSQRLSVGLAVAAVALIDALQQRRDLRNAAQKQDH